MRRVGFEWRVRTTNPIKLANVVVDDREWFNCGEKDIWVIIVLIRRTVVVHMEAMVVLMEVVEAMVEVVMEAVVEDVAVLVPLWLQLRKLCLSLWLWNNSRYGNNGRREKLVRLLLTLQQPPVTLVTLSTAHLGEGT
jgi:hypothetical protein